MHSIISKYIKKFGYFNIIIYIFIQKYYKHIYYLNKAHIKKEIYNGTYKQSKVKFKPWKEIFNPWQGFEDDEPYVFLIFFKHSP